MRNYSPFDQLIMNADTALRTLFGQPLTTHREYPADDISDADFSEQDKKHIAGLMRVNHCGEVSAQALYQGQSMTSRNKDIKEKLQQAALEENDHLEWTKNRLDELGSHTSLLNPLWYAGSLAIGAAAGAIGDKWNLGFLAETEHQVVEHLESHLNKLPGGDLRSRAILEQMKIDEQKHATTAIEQGAAELPPTVKTFMMAMSKVMTGAAYYI
ncbi:2-polyprenyl-3-methyl-6-methoxy-1,4-benzoquinol hydroxylase, coq7 type [hydrothermal vent metagenome]|uniref:2-polyprenyl-3-methyl-6-methoxy-1,4-benzoquinol hydroxylase, coq7 type n=1 Tax=hydrothermal vent metagenome TaxID=652676 RepID=A0A3B0WD41_9ZZZZ